MLRTLKMIVLVVLAAILVLFGVLNMERVEVEILPEGLIHTIFPSTQAYDFGATMPLALLILICVFAGIVLGYLFEWVREHKHRRTAKVKKREAAELHAENRQLKRQLDNDDLPKIAVR